MTNLLLRLSQSCILFTGKSNEHTSALRARRGKPYLLVGLFGGSDRGSNHHVRQSPKSGDKLHDQQEIVDPLLCDLEGPSDLFTFSTAMRCIVAHTRLPEDQWAQVAQRYHDGESLRQLAKALCAYPEKTVLRQIR
jgi:hypothetical protein